MEFHTLSRRELQVLCKRNKIPANMTNAAMADALAALQHVEGLEEFLNPSEPNVAMQSPEKAPPETLAVLRTATRASARAKPTKDPDSSQVVSRARRSTVGSRHAAADQENKQVNLPDTPAVPKTGKRAGLASARRRPEATKREEKNEEENRDVPKSSTVKGTQRQARASAVPRVYSTRRSARLLEKSMSELKVSEERASELEPIKMDDLDSKEESEEVLEEIQENKNALDADSQAAEEESSKRPDHSNVPVEKSTGIEEKERELLSDVNVNVNVESSCVGALGSEVLLEAECGKSDCLSALSDSNLKDDVLDEKLDQLDDNLHVSTLNQDAPPIDNQSDDIDVAVICGTEENGLENPLLPEEQMVENNEGVLISESITSIMLINTNCSVVSTLNQDAPPVDNQSDDIDVAVICGTEENGLENPLLPEEQMMENNEGVLISETIICTSDDSDQLVPHITANSDRLVPHCDDFQEPVGNNDAGVEISMSSQLEIRDIAPVEQEESIKLDQLMSPCPVSPVVQTEKHEDEQLVEVDVIESEEFAMEVREWHKSLVETSAAAKSSEVNAPHIQEYADLQGLVDVHVMQEVEFVEGACELPPSAIGDKTPINVSNISPHSPLAVNGKVALSPLTADRLPKSPMLMKSSSKKKSTVRKMANKLDNNKENMGILPSPLAVAADQLQVKSSSKKQLDNNKENMDIPPSPLAVATDQLQVKSSSKKQSALRKMTTLLGDDKENMQKGGRKVEPNTEKAKKKSEEEKITDEDRVLESLQKKSLRQLKKMFKEKLGTTETEREKDATEQQLGSARPALRVLSENQMALGEVEGN
ncbi:uncharacterized protein LOC115673323 isoform X2 [Syzygium oleosum]|uniref:uncharacterized protein LOC115673323 isoform X2 n=1 Tax=Syzygium oleosum TaxID=219896 RepID=UPI0024B8E8A8|nr:uncharacterized protein LOC115673323 isoform X2 [Syzygium oleosum]